MMGDTIGRENMELQLLEARQEFPNFKQGQSTRFANIDYSHGPMTAERRITVLLGRGISIASLLL